MLKSYQTLVLRLVRPQIQTKYDESISADQLEETNSNSEESKLQKIKFLLGRTNTTSSL